METRYRQIQSNVGLVAPWCGSGALRVIDLHCYMLPGVDDGAPDLDTAFAMARLALADGVTITACTPHITPGVYENQGPAILSVIDALQARRNYADIPVALTSGCDAHLAPDLGEGLKDGRVLPLGGGT